jgi:hypothetical protein
LDLSTIAKFGVGTAGAVGAYAASSSMIRAAALDDVAGPRKRDRTPPDLAGDVGYEQDRSPMLTPLTWITAGGAALVGGGGGMYLLDKAARTPMHGVGAAARLGAAALLIGAGIGGVTGAVSSYDTNMGLEPYKRDQR